MHGGEVTLVAFKPVGHVAYAAYGPIWQRAFEQLDLFSGINRSFLQDAVVPAGASGDDEAFGEVRHFPFVRELPAR